MAGLEKILEDIRSESAQAVALSPNRHRRSGRRSLRKPCREADARRGEDPVHGKEGQADDLIARADSAAQLQRRRMILETKQDLIASVIGQAKQAILDLTDSDYFELILKLIRSNALPRDGEICF